jgi:hypothetical protein
MLRIVLGVVVGFISWMIAWIGVEKLLSALWPAFGVHQAEFQSVIENGGQFTADSTMLLTHIVIASIVSVLSGYLAALVAGENVRAPLVLVFLLLAMGLMKAYMSWQYVPIWYHVVFTLLLIPMAIIGGKLYSAN